MKKALLFIFFGFFIGSCSSTKIRKSKIRYFDKNNVEISKSEFSQIRSTKKQLVIPGDSINHKKLIAREKHGRITNRHILESMLEKESEKKIDANKPIVIIYYPGKDPCNSSGTTNKEWVKNWYEQLENGLNQVAQVKPIYIFKENEGLQKYDGILDWKKDPDGIVERLFFKHHYPCSSFVVISKNGDYIGYFGEFSKEYVWEATQLMNK